MDVRNVLSGTHGTMYLNGIPVFEVKNCEAKVEVMREEVFNGNSLDTKITGLKGTGEFTVSHTYDRGFKELLAAYKRGQDPRSHIDVFVSDPDAKGGQRENTTLNNVWFNELTIANFVKGELINRSFPFGFTPSDADMTEVVHA